MTSPIPTTKEAALALCMSQTSFLRWLKGRPVPVVKLSPRRFRIRQSDLDQFIQSITVKGVTV